MNQISQSTKVVLSALLAILLVSGGIFYFSQGTKEARAQESEGAQAPVVLRHEGLPPAGILPTSPLYFFKRFGESIVTFFTFGDANKAVRHFELAQRRLAEAEELAAQKKFDAAKPVFERYDKELAKTQKYLEAADLRGKNMSKLAEKILTILPIKPSKPEATEVKTPTKQAQDVLGAIRKTAPEEAQKGLQTAEESLQKVSQKILAKQPSGEGQQGGGGYRGSEKLGLCDGLSSQTISDDIQDMKALGFGWGRPRGDVFAQETIEKTKGSYNFSTPDAIVKAMQNAGVKIFGTVFPTGIPKIPSSVDASSFKNYVKAVVDRYNGDGKNDMPGLATKITYWQVGIEPFCQTQSETCYKNFLDLTKIAYQAAKEVDSSVMISPGGVGPIYGPTAGIDPQVAAAIFKYFFENGGANYMDFFNFHYLVGTDSTDIGTYVSFWKKYSGNKELWISETGSRDVNDRFTISSDADKEAAWVKQHIADSFKSGVAKIFWCRAEHSFSDMPKVVGALQEYAQKYGGNPSGSVAKRQTQKSGTQQQQESGSQQQSGTQQQQSGGFQQQSGGIQSGGFQQQSGGTQSGGFQQQSGGFQQQSGGTQSGGGTQQPSSGGYCGDNKCDSIEQQTGGCPQDCSVQ